MAINRREDVLELCSIQERVREKFNPDWRRYLRMHREMLGRDPETGKVLEPELKLAGGAGSEHGSGAGPK